MSVIHRVNLMSSAIAICLSACSTTHSPTQTQNQDSKVLTVAAPIAETVPAPTATPTEAEKAQDVLVLPKSIHGAVNSSYRSTDNTARDRYRHPDETLTFFGLKPNMTVVEISPGAGWYTEILAPYLATGGQYIAAIPPVGQNASANETSAKVIAWLKSHKEFSGHIAIADFTPSSDLELARPGTADLVVTFRNVHNWIMKGTEHDVFNAFFRALKPGGILGVEEHRADPKKPRDPKTESGYVLEKDVIALAQQAGFTLIAKSQINANPKDTKDYPSGVWTLPPTLRLKDQDREKYLAIGESDRMTLKFMKPKLSSKAKK